MNKIRNYILACACMAGLSSCMDTFLDLEPLDAKTDVIYFKTQEHFREYANGLYSQLIGWQSGYGSIFDHMDVSSDLSANFQYSYGVGTGNLSAGGNDSRWGNCYANIRATNILLEKAKTYSGSREDIQVETGEGHFFRAYNYFYLLKFFGGVPIVTGVLDVDSPELMGVRSSRYEVVNLILSDLDAAIAVLPREENIAAGDKGRISQQAAKAFKARVLLYEATWRKYNGTSTDFEGSAGPSSDQVNSFLEESAALSKEVMDDTNYSLWNYNNVDAMKNLSNRYLFNIEEAGSNPAGAGRDTNKEFVIAAVYSRDTRKGQVELSRIVYTLRPSRKLVDMFLCSDGLPISMSDKFKGYKTPGDEYENRDYRLESYIGKPDESTNLTGDAGYGTYKFAVTDISYNNKDESANYPVLRLAEVYLNYAEAVMERYGEISDEQLDNSVNKIRERAGIADLTNALAAQIKNGVAENADKSLSEVMLDEIRRERTLELYMEGYRCDDLKRWGIAEEELNESRCGMIVGNADYPTVFVDSDGDAVSDRYKPASYTKGTEEVDTPFGKLPAVVLLKSTDCSFNKMDYLWPIPQDQINLNPNLVQNPGY